MQDIDFDELDRAVNSVINPSTSSTSDDSASIEKPVDPPSSTPTAAVTDTAAKSEQPAERSAASAPASPAARRSTGRFMDVVHPSSDMRPQGATKVSEPATEKPVPAPTPAPSPSVNEEASSASSEFKWPDPIDLAGHEEKEEAPVEKDAAPAEASAPTSSEPAPLDSPFLPDAKVEKRPLGGTPPETSVDLSEVLKDFTPKAADLTIPEEPKVASTGAVDLSSLEISEEALIGSKESSDTVPEEVAVPTPSTETAERPLTVPSEASVNKPLVNDSIAQQYKEQPSTVDQPSGAIYDTEAYHQPLAHPQKKKTGLSIILWIVGLIVIGGGLGAVLYLYVLPAL